MRYADKLCYAFQKGGEYEEHRPRIAKSFRLMRKSWQKDWERRRFHLFAFTLGYYARLTDEENTFLKIYERAGRAHREAA